MKVWSTCPRGDSFNWNAPSLTRWLTGKPCHCYDTRKGQRLGALWHDIFLPVCDALHVAVCGVLSSLDWKGHTGNMIDVLGLFVFLLPTPPPPATPAFSIQTDLRLQIYDNRGRCRLSTLSTRNRIWVHPSHSWPCSRCVLSLWSKVAAEMDGWIEWVGMGGRGGAPHAQKRNGRALQSPARSLPGFDAQHLIPGCFPFPAGGAFPPLWKNALPSPLSPLHLSVFMIPTKLHSASYTPLAVHACRSISCTVQKMESVPRPSASSLL